MNSKIKEMTEALNDAIDSEQEIASLDALEELSKARKTLILNAVDSLDREVAP